MRAVNHRACDLTVEITDLRLVSFLIRHWRDRPEASESEASKERGRSRRSLHDKANGQHINYANHSDACTNWAARSQWANKKADEQKLKRNDNEKNARRNAGNNLATNKFAASEGVQACAGDRPTGVRVPLTATVHSCSASNCALFKVAVPLTVHCELYSRNNKFQDFFCWLFNISPSHLSTEESFQRDAVKGSSSFSKLPKRLAENVRPEVQQNLSEKLKDKVLSEEKARNDRSSRAVRLKENENQFRGIDWIPSLFRRPLYDAEQSNNVVHTMSGFPPHQNYDGTVTVGSLADQWLVPAVRLRLRRLERPRCAANRRRSRNYPHSQKVKARTVSSGFERDFQTFRLKRNNAFY
ncbi:hypothetical protein L1887_61778 [Cichorium endivia]|nr:hypothetical protein L1887_61778 [Cichorium endivia]